MRRFLLSRYAEQDLDDILDYLSHAPYASVQRVVAALQLILHSIGDQPLLGMKDSNLSIVLDQEVRSRLMAP